MRGQGNLFTALVLCADKTLAACIRGNDIGTKYFVDIAETDPSHTYSVASWPYSCEMSAAVDTSTALAVY
jgi:hypothetical protein